MTTLLDYIKKGWPKPGIFQLIKDDFYLNKDKDNYIVTKEDIVNLFEKIDLADEDYNDLWDPVLEEIEPISGYKVRDLLTKTENSCDAYCKLSLYEDIYQIWMSYVINHGPLRNIINMYKVIQINNGKINYECNVLLAVRLGEYEVYCYTLYEMIREYDRLMKIYNYDLPEPMCGVNYDDIIRLGKDNYYIQSSNALEQIIIKICEYNIKYCIGFDFIYHKPEHMNDQGNPGVKLENFNDYIKRYKLYIKTVKLFLRSKFDRNVVFDEGFESRNLTNFSDLLVENLTNYNNLLVRKLVEIENIMKETDCNNIKDTTYNFDSFEYKDAHNNFIKRAHDIIKQYTVKI